MGKMDKGPYDENSDSLENMENPFNMIDIVDEIPETEGRQFLADFLTSNDLSDDDDDDDSTISEVDEIERQEILSSFAATQITRNLNIIDLTEDSGGEGDVPNRPDNVEQIKEEPIENSTQEVNSVHEEPSAPVVNQVQKDPTVEEPAIDHSQEIKVVPEIITFDEYMNRYNLVLNSSKTA